MGIIWSRFRKKECTKDQLKKIQEEINSFEEYKEHTEQRRKKLVGNFIAFNIFIFFVAAIVWYIWYLPPTLKECFINATPFFGFILLIYIIKSILTWYYRWKMRRNENKLVSLKRKKEEILDQVMETETYKVAKDILETFAPEQMRRAAMSFKSPVITPAASSHRMPMPQSDVVVRRRIVSPQLSQSFGPRPTPSSVRSSGPPGSYPYARPSATPHSQPPIGRPIVKDVSTSSYSSLQNPRVVYSSATPMNSSLFTPRNDGGSAMPMLTGNTNETPGRPMPRPILPRERGLLERFVEYLVGDGPSNRYALVCRQCESHNGMALKEEFPYIAFRCAYCFYWNPARKQKPSAPRLETVPQRVSAEMTRRVLENEEAEEEETSSDEEGEEEEESETDSNSTSSPSSDNREDAGKNCLTNTSYPTADVGGTGSRGNVVNKDANSTSKGKSELESGSSELGSGHSVESSSIAAPQVNNEPEHDSQTAPTESKSEDL